MPGARVGTVVGSKVVGSEVLGVVVGHGLGAGVVGAAVGASVGSESVGDRVGSCVGRGVVGAGVGAGVGAREGGGVGAAVGSEVLGITVEAAGDPVRWLRLHWRPDRNRARATFSSTTWALHVGMFRYRMRFRKLQFMSSIDSDGAKFISVATDAEHAA